MLNKFPCTENYSDSVGNNSLSSKCHILSKKRISGHMFDPTFCFDLSSRQFDLFLLLPPVPYFEKRRRNPFRVSGIHEIGDFYFENERFIFTAAFSRIYFSRKNALKFIFFYDENDEAGLENDFSLKEFFLNKKGAFLRILEFTLENGSDKISTFLLEEETVRMETSRSHVRSLSKSQVASIGKQISLSRNENSKYFQMN